MYDDREVKETNGTMLGIVGALFAGIVATGMFISAQRMTYKAQEQQAYQQCINANPITPENIQLCKAAFNQE